MGNVKRMMRMRMNLIAIRKTGKIVRIMETMKMIWIMNVMNMMKLFATTRVTGMDIMR